MNDNPSSGSGSRAVQPQGAFAEARPPQPRVTDRERSEKFKRSFHAVALLVAKSEGLSVSDRAVEWALGHLDGLLLEIDHELRPTIARSDD